MSKKDIFIDNNIASNFTNPMDKEYKKLIKWLMLYNEKEDTDAYLVVSNALLGEYNRSSMGNFSGTNIAVIVDKLTREGRLDKITNEQIKDFESEYFTKKMQKNLTCNTEDRKLIPVVLLSVRKFAITLDEKFKKDLDKFPQFNATVAKRPEKIDYENG